MGLFQLNSRLIAASHNFSGFVVLFPNFVPDTIYKSIQKSNNKTFFQIKHKKTLFPFETAIKNLSNTISLTLETSCSLSNSILYVTEDISQLFSKIKRKDKKLKKTKSKKKKNNLIVISKQCSDSRYTELNIQKKLNSSSKILYNTIEYNITATYNIILECKQ